MRLCEEGQVEVPVQGTFRATQPQGGENLQGLRPPIPFPGAAGTLLGWKKQLGEERLSVPEREDPRSG